MLCRCHKFLIYSFLLRSGLAEHPLLDSVVAKLVQSEHSRTLFPPWAEARKAGSADGSGGLQGRAVANQRRIFFVLQFAALYFHAFVGHITSQCVQNMTQRD